MILAYVVLRIIRESLPSRVGIGSRACQAAVFDLPEPPELPGSVPCVFDVPAARASKHFPGRRKPVLYKWLYGVAGAADKCGTH